MSDASIVAKTIWAQSVPIASLGMLFSRQIGEAQDVILEACSECDDDLVLNALFDQQVKRFTELRDACTAGRLLMTIFRL
jgi:hypothetical protein